MPNLKSLAIAVFFILFLYGHCPFVAWAANIPEPNCACAYCNRPCGSGHASNCPYNQGGGGGGRETKSDPLSAPILTVPVGCLVGVFTGFGWYIDEMSGKNDKTDFFTSYFNHQKVKTDDDRFDNGFSAGMFLGGTPALLLYMITGPIRYGVVSLGDAISRPSFKPAPAPKSSDQPADDYFSDGQILETAGNFAEAERKYRLAIQYNPNSPRYFSKLAHVLSHQGKNKEAEDWYRKAANAYAPGDPNYAVAVNGLFEAVNAENKSIHDKVIIAQENLLRRGEYKKAIPLAYSSLITDPSPANSSRYLENLVKAHKEQGQLIPAGAALQLNAQLNPSQKNIDDWTKFASSPEYKAAREELTESEFEKLRELGEKCFNTGRGIGVADCQTSLITLGIPEPQPNRSLKDLIDSVPKKLKKDPGFAALVKESEQIEKNEATAYKALLNIKNAANIDEKTKQILIVEQAKKMEEFTEAKFEKKVEIENYVDLSFPK